jgi:hypothetical protein
MKRLWQLISGDTRIVITTGHAHTDSPKNRKFKIDPSTPVNPNIEPQLLKEV